MPRVTVSRSVAAPPAEVFAACADFARAADRIKDILRVEVLSPGPVGVGTRFKETRKMFGKEATETMEVVAFDPPAGYELRAVNCGTEYRTWFTFTPDGAGTRVDATFQSRAVALWAWPFTPLMYLMRGFLRKCLAGDLDQIRAAIEGQKLAA